MVQLKPATLSDNSKLLSLVEKTPQQGLVVLNFERSPNFFHGSNVSTQEPFVTLAQDEKTGEAVAVYSNGKRDVFYNGQVKSLRYVSDLRIAKNHRGKGLVRKLIEESQAEMKPGEYSQMVILKENAASLISVASGRNGLATFYPMGTLTTYLISTVYDFSSSSNYDVRPATQSDIPEMQALFDREAANKQFYPAYDFSKIGCDDYYRGLDISDYYLAIKDGAIVGILGTWKQNIFKQTRVIEYPFWMRFLRPYYNLWTRYFGGFPLPLKSEVAEYVSLHTIISKDNSTDIMSCLLTNVRKVMSKKGEDTMIMGFTDSDPLSKSLKGFVYKTMESNHYIGGFDGDIREVLDKSLPLYVEVARL